MKKLLILLCFLPLISFGKIVPYNFNQTVTLKYTDKFCAGEILNTSNQGSKIDTPIPFTCKVRETPMRSCTIISKSFWYSYKKNGIPFWSVKGEDGDLHTSSWIKRIVWTKKDKSMSICMVNANSPDENYPNKACNLMINCHYTTSPVIDLYTFPLKIIPSNKPLPIIPIP